MQKAGSLSMVLFSVSLCLCGQPHGMDFGLEAGSSYAGPVQVPFWMRSNHYGSVPPEGISLFVEAWAGRDYDAGTKQKIDWGFSSAARFNLGDPARFILEEGYGKARFSIFEIRAGRIRDMTGLCDSTLGSGAWAVSGNAPGIPKIEASIPEFYTLPVLGRMFAFKGSFAHGWMGKAYDNRNNPLQYEAYLHQLTLYGRFGRENWRLKLYGGFNHQVVWGNEDSIMGEDFELSSLRNYLYIVTGKEYNHGSIQATRIGNHLGSIDLGFTCDWPALRLFVYRQFIYDAGALYYLANLRDGLNGISLVHKAGSDRSFTWSKVILEFLYTKNQAGETWSPETTSLYENYYNNGYYDQGWSYKEAGIGNPFITPAGSAKEGFPSSGSYFINNRVLVVHTGLETRFRKWDFTARFSYSRNYGSYATSATGKIWDGGVNPDPSRIFPVTDQFSSVIEAGTLLKNGLRLEILTALDAGGLFDDAIGIQVSLSRSF